MLSPAIRMARDYNRGLVAPVRWAHFGFAVLSLLWRELFAKSPVHRFIMLPIALGVLGFLLVHPYDADISHGAARWAASLPGDVRRELFAWQQFGQGFAIILTCACVWLLEPRRRRRLLDLLLAVGMSFALAQGAKMLVGRPRPRPQFEDPHTFLGPLGQYPIVLKNGEVRLVHAWESAAGADLWSMPSSHTMMAAVLGVFLSAMYPRLRPLLVFMVALVGVARVLFDAHWPTDVIVGAALGVMVSGLIVDRYAGVRLLDSLWSRLIDRSASPALPRLLESESQTRVV